MAEAPPAPLAPTPEELSIAPPPSGRSEITRAIVVPLLAFVTALAVGAIFIIFSDVEALRAWSSFFRNPLRALTVSGHAVGTAYGALFRGSLGSVNAISETIVNATPLMFAGLSVALGFRAGLFNIGAEGQITVGAIAASAAGFSFAGLPGPVHILLVIVAGFLGGAVWGAIPGILKARTGAHEVIVTIMLNFVAFRLADYALSTAFFHRPDRFDPISKPVVDSAQLPHILGAGNRAHAGLVLALLVAAGMWWLMRRTTLGFRFRVVGSNPDAARYAGIRPGRIYIVAMTLAGGLAGLAASNQLMGVNHSLTAGFSSGFGFDAIALALLGGATPVGVVLAALLFGMLHAGAVQMQASTQIPVDIVVIVQALVIMFVAAPALVRAIYRIRARRVAGADTFTKGWAG